MACFWKNSNNNRISSKTTPIKGVQTPPSWPFIVNKIAENPCANCWIRVNWWKPTAGFVKITFRSCSCHLRLHTCNRSLFARGLSIDSRAYVISKHVHWPIGAPLPTCANQDAWVVITPKRPKANSFDTAARHAWTRTPPLNSVLKAVFSLIYFPASFMRLWPSCHSALGDRGVAGGCS